MRTLKTEKILTKVIIDMPENINNEKKAEILLDLCESEILKNQQIDFINAINSFNGMIKEMDKIDMVAELQYAIIILKNYIKHKKFNLITFSNHNDDITNMKFKMLNDFFSMIFIEKK